jgi:hypothetical protein
MFSADEPCGGHGEAPATLIVNALMAYDLALSSCATARTAMISGATQERANRSRHFANKILKEVGLDKAFYSIPRRRPCRRTRIDIKRRRE